MNSSRLDGYRRKRRPGASGEPFGTLRLPGANVFVVHHHLASREHYDLRLEVDGHLWSWAVPKVPSADPTVKRLAVRTEDHPLDYAWFEGLIAPGNYGAGAMIVWDRGRWSPVSDPEVGLREGKLLFDLQGFKLQGRWTLVRTREAWLLIKERDRWAESDRAYPADSVVSGLAASELRDGASPCASLRRDARRAGASAPAPAQAAPMLCAPGEPFTDPDWLFEIKYDGYRVMVERADDDVVLRTRGGHDVASTFPEIREATLALPCPRFLLDGELLVADPAGLPDFSRLQQRAQLTRPVDVARAALVLTASYQAFDLLAFGDLDLRSVPLEQRKELLRRLLPTVGYLAWVDHVLGAGEDLFRQACAVGLEGIVAKRRASRYRAGRGEDWRKIPALRTARFAVVGHVPDRHGHGLGSLVLAARRGEAWVPVGRVGVALAEEERGSLEATLRALPAERVVPARAGPRETAWVRPAVTVAVRFKDYTQVGHLRQPVLLAVTPDVPPDACRAGPWANDDVAPAEATSERPPGPVVVTNRDKCFWPADGLTKGDLVAYYRAVAPWMLPYLADRPVVLTRYPDGIEGKSFFQHRAPDFVPDWIPRVRIFSEAEGEERDYLLLESAEALAYVANLGTIPIHVWHARAATLQQPDWCLLDLDPKGAPFADVVAVARVLHALCEEARIPAYLKTSGATGLHILIPTGGRLSHDQSRTLAELLARLAVARAPAITTVQRVVEQRAGRVYVDYLQNGHGKTIAAPFCVRPLPGAPVSMPLRWVELAPRSHPGRYHLRNAIRRLRALDQDPLAGLLGGSFDPVQALERLAGLLAAGA